MKEVTIRPMIKHGVGYWIVPYLVPSWCSSCPPNRETILIKSETRPTEIEIKNELYKKGYEIKNI